MHKVTIKYSHHALTLSETFYLGTDDELLKLIEAAKRGAFKIIKHSPIAVSTADQILAVVEDGR